MNNIIAWLGGAAFLFMLSIVGAVERGAPLVHALWSIPALIVLGLCAELSNIDGKNKNSKHYPKAGKADIYQRESKTKSRRAS